MMDLSDGLASDLPRLAAASKCSFHIDESRLPRTPGCTLRHALADGEDYELLFAIAPGKTAALERAWKKQFPKLPLTRIGALIQKSKFKTLNQRVRGFDHFA
jgi:thiamine-monophosphate kinase